MARKMNKLCWEDSDWQRLCWSQGNLPVSLSQHLFTAISPAALRGCSSNRPSVGTQPSPNDALFEKSLALIQFLVNLDSFFRTTWKKSPVWNMNGLKLHSLSKCYWMQVKVIKSYWAPLSFSQLWIVRTFMEHLISVCFYNSELFDLYFASSLKNTLKGE